MSQRVECQLTYEAVLKVTSAAVNGKGKQAAAVEEPSAVKAEVDSLEDTIGTLPPLPETDANEPQEDDMKEGDLEDRQHGMSFTDI